jgi:hypothetical protein
MSQGPIPPRYPPQNPYQSAQPVPQQPMPPQTQQPQMPVHPQAEQDSFLVNVPGQTPAPQGPASQPIPYYTPMAEHSGGVWNQGGGILVMHKQAQLPPLCIKCCTPTEGQPLKRNVTWHPGWVYLLILPGLLIYAIVALSIQEKATIYVPLCDKHRGKRRLHLWLAIGIFFASLACFFLEAYANRSSQGTFAMIGLLLLVTSIIYAVFFNSRLVVTPHKIDAQYVWLKGASPQFVSQFPSMQ